MVKRIVVGLAALALTFAAPARAAGQEAEPKPVPRLHHAPRSTAEVGEPLEIGAVIDHADRVKRALLLYRAETGTAEIAFQRSGDAELPWVAVVPASAVRAPSLAYAIEIETTSNERLPVFASRASPHPVAVLDAAEDAREGALLARLGGRRSVVQAGGDYVSFGTSTADVAGERRNVADRYFRTEGSYTYRLLGTVSEFGLRAGVVRGRSLVPGEVDPSKYDVGLNYGAPRVRLRAADWLHLEGELLISVTEVGFSMGGGGAVIFGDAYGSRLTVGGEGIEVFGARGYTRLDVVASRWLTVAPVVEVTSMPHADQAGVRLLGEAGVALGGGFRLDVRGGYQARSFERGGPSVGGGLAYAF